MRPIRMLGAALTAGLLIAACSGVDADTGDASGEGPVEEEVEAEEEPVAGEGSDAGSDGSVSGAASIDPSPRHVIYTIELVIETDDVARAAARAAALAETSGGFVAHESTEGTESATLTLRIPSARHTTVVSDLEELGEVRSAAAAPRMSQRRSSISMPGLLPSGAALLASVSCSTRPATCPTWCASSPSWPIGRRISIPFSAARSSSPR